jgi:hypothetical protein
LMTQQPCSKLRVPGHRRMQFIPADASSYNHYWNGKGIELAS